MNPLTFLLHGLTLLFVGLKLTITAVELFAVANENEWV